MQPLRDDQLGQPGLRPTPALPAEEGEQGHHVHLDALGTGQSHRLPGLAQRGAAIGQNHHPPGRAGGEQGHPEPDRALQVGLVGARDRGHLAQFAAAHHRALDQGIGPEEHQRRLVVGPHLGQGLLDEGQRPLALGFGDAVGGVDQEDDGQLVGAVDGLDPGQAEDDERHDQAAQDQRRPGAPTAVAARRTAEVGEVGQDYEEK